MEPQAKTRRILRKIWYGAAITLSALVLLLSAAGLIGAWVIEQTLVDVSQDLLGASANVASGLRRVTGQIDQGVAQVRQISSQVTDTSLKISQNIEDKGLVLTLLPAEQEQNLVEQAQQIQETLDNIREVLSAGISLYHSINRLPLVSLPAPDPESIEQIQASAASAQATIAEMRQSAQDFRSGASSQVSRVTQASERVTQGMDQLHAELSDLDQDLAALADFALRAQQAVPLVFGLGALAISLLMVYVIYSQVEMMRLLVGRWKALEQGEL